MATLYEAPGSIEPTLNRADPISLVVDHGNYSSTGYAYITSWNVPGNKPVDAVSAVLMHDHIYNEFVLDKGTSSGTDWVVTMPTKGVPDAYYLSKFGTMGSPGDKELKVTRLFQRNFKETGACDDVDLSKYDREEKLDKVTSSFSPPPPGQRDQLCWEANVITFRGSNVLGSKNQFNIANASFTFENGWADLSFTNSGTSATRPSPAGWRRHDADQPRRTAAELLLLGDVLRPAGHRLRRDFFSLPARVRLRPVRAAWRRPGLRRGWPVARRGAARLFAVPGRVPGMGLAHYTTPGRSRRRGTQRVVGWAGSRSRWGECRRRASPDGSRMAPDRASARPGVGGPATVRRVGGAIRPLQAVLCACHPD
ncbi:MAG: hypothetical protein IPG84_15080 [Betaproteobacteria bacterium]|nr:hypothetical protein [Betaproteobacteria bacterium]